MKQIAPITLTLNKGTANAISVRPINIELHKDNCDCYWQLFSIDDEKTTQIEDGNLNIPSSIYLNWADDDSIIENYVIDQLGLENL